MMIVGQVNNKEEANEITFIAKLFVVGQRARDLAHEKGKTNQNKNSQFCCFLFNKLYLVAVVLKELNGD